MKDEIREEMEREVKAAMPAPASQGVSANAMERDGVEALRFIDLRYEPSEEGGRAVPGLADAGLEPEVRDRIAYLTAEIGTINVALLDPPAPVTFPVERAEEIVDELQATFEWLAFRDRKLAPVVAALGGEIPQTKEAAAWAVALDHYVAFGRKHEARLRPIRAFDMALLDEGQRLADGYEKAAASSEATLRARLAALMVVLREQLRLVRAAADYVYHRYPGIAAEARSERLRRQQAAAVQTRRRNAKAKKAKAAQPAVQAAKPEVQAEQPAVEAAQPAASSALASDLPTVRA